LTTRKFSPSPTAQTARTQTTPPKGITATASQASTSPKASSKTTPKKVRAGIPPCRLTTTHTTKTPRLSRPTTQCKLEDLHIHLHIHSTERALTQRPITTETPSAGFISSATGVMKNTPKTTQSRSVCGSASCACTPAGPRGRLTSSWSVKKFVLTVRRSAKCGASWCSDGLLILLLLSLLGNVLDASVGGDVMDWMDGFGGSSTLDFGFLNLHATCNRFVHGV
jgi:hypothetical protein